MKTEIIFHILHLPLRGRIFLCMLQVITEISSSSLYIRTFLSNMLEWFQVSVVTVLALAAISGYIPKNGNV